MPLLPGTDQPPDSIAGHLLHMKVEENAPFFNSADTG